MLEIWKTIRAIVVSIVLVGAIISAAVFFNRTWKAVKKIEKYYPAEIRGNVTIEGGTLEHPVIIKGCSFKQSLEVKRQKKEEDK